MFDFNEKRVKHHLSKTHAIRGTRTIRYFRLLIACWMIFLTLLHTKLQPLHLNSKDKQMLMQTFP